MLAAGLEFGVGSSLYRLVPSLYSEDVGSMPAMGLLLVSGWA